MENRQVKIKSGAEVVDRNAKVLGSVDYLARDTWTGEIAKFIVTRKAPAEDLFLTLEDVLEATETKITLNNTPDKYK